ncbi:protein kinase C-binding protein NELL1-like isoform X2 [Anopheles aquasalis]|uniref:protein kinase C-binding protein NELL1-like isoform X2 n=1 Tax=Anopheles aquasalis TaxID=42839 RepID=UPI00215B59BE|nr:protein kinase C-binding protein NELL1-like isoform X2 [Anopheles aquasalis]
MTKHLWNYDTSWRCVQALAAILSILLLPGSGGALDPGIDLLDALNSHSNLSQYPGVMITPSRVYHLSGVENRNLVLPAAVFRRAVEQMKKSSEFTFSAVLKQELSNSGTIVSFSNGVNRYLELQSSGRRDEIRFHYTHITAAGATQMLTETFPYRLADDTEHKVSLTVSGSEMQLFIDCHPLYKRVTHFIPDRNFSASNMQLFVGQRNSNSHYLFKGEIKDLRLITGPYGYLSQCELMDAQCPTCGQFLELENALLELKQAMSLLTKRLVDAEKRVSYIEECDCKKSCLINGTTKNDGDAWDIGCSRCECRQGEVKCGPRPCPEVKCKHPVLKEGECCPVCLKSCYITRKDFEHGETQILGCRNCSCVDGNMHCEFLQCPELKCPPEQQMSVTDECCKFCQDTPNRRKNRPHKRPHGGGGGGGGGGGARRQHHKNSTHRNKHSKKKKHEHNTALQLHTAEDVDECTQQGGLNGNHCHLNTRCVNTFGSYECECLPGYRRQDKFNCVELDECKSGKHGCHQHADCTNTLGSYHCHCKAGYTGDGYECKPVCNQTCLNGGECEAPGVCKCRAGYIGDSCEKDLDECTTGQHRCGETTDCVNMPGWYFCKCKSGFETKGSGCVDIDECKARTHSCHPSAQCVNTQGHFNCECPIDSGPNCRLSCMFEDNEIPDGSQVSPRNQPCKVCTCSKGVISCVEPPCNCSSWRRGASRDLCCPQCDPKESCQHQELPHVSFRSGEQWIYQCQTCECLYGEFDCWKLECPPLPCDNPLPAGPADCCPRCPHDVCGFGNVTTVAPESSTIAGVGKCSFENHSYASGQTFKYPSSNCVTCSCKDGNVTCSYDDNCSDADSVGAPPRVVSEHDPNDMLKYTVANHKPPQATAAAMLEDRPKHGHSLHQIEGISGASISRISRSSSSSDGNDGGSPGGPIPGTAATAAGGGSTIENSAGESLSTTTVTNAAKGISSHKDNTNNHRRSSSIAVPLSTSTLSREGTRSGQSTGATDVAAEQQQLVPVVHPDVLPMGSSLPAPAQDGDKPDDIVTQQQQQQQHIAVGHQTPSKYPGSSVIPTVSEHATTQTETSTTTTNTNAKRSSLFPTPFPSPFNADSGERAEMANPRHRRRKRNERG